MNKVTLNPGNYWIGDPCFVFPDPTPLEDPWDDVLQATGFFAIKNYFKDDKIEVWATTTEFSSYVGTFFSKFGDVFPVDSGLLGIVSVSSFEFLKPDLDFLDEAGSFITFEEPFEVFEENGVIHFGPLLVDMADYESEGLLMFEEEEDE